MKKRVLSIISLILTLILSIGLFSVTAYAAGTKTITDATNAVVRVLTVDPLTGSISTGSAFGIGGKGKTPEYFVTNKHVVDCENTVALGNVELDLEYTAIKVYIMKSNLAFVYNSLSGQYELESSQLIPCDVVYESDKQYPDIAIIRPVEKMEGYITLPLVKKIKESDRASTVYALGFPGQSDLVNQSSTASYFVSQPEDVTITQGIMSRYGSFKTLDNCKYIEHDAVINHGNSGGPLLNEDGAVLGINANSFEKSDSSAATYYAVGYNYIIDACEECDIPYYTIKKMNAFVIVLLVLSILVVLAGIGALIYFFFIKKKPAPVPAPQVSEIKPNPSNGGFMPTSPVSQDNAPRLMGISGTYSGQRFSMDKDAFIGCGKANNNLPLPEGTPGVSHKHCVVKFAEGKVTLTDLGSQYGTFLENGTKLSPNAPVTLNLGDAFYLGSKSQMFRITGKGGI